MTKACSTYTRQRPDYEISEQNTGTGDRPKITSPQKLERRLRLNQCTGSRRQGLPQQTLPPTCPARPRTCPTPSPTTRTTQARKRRVTGDTAHAGGSGQVRTRTRVDDMVEVEVDTMEGSQDASHTGESLQADVKKTQPESIQSAKTSITACDFLVGSRSRPRAQGRSCNRR